MGSQFSLLPTAHLHSSTFALVPLTPPPSPPPQKAYQSICLLCHNCTNLVANGVNSNRNERYNLQRKEVECGYRLPTGDKFYFYLVRKRHSRQSEQVLRLRKPSRVKCTSKSYHTVNKYIQLFFVQFSEATFKLANWLTGWRCFASVISKTEKKKNPLLRIIPFVFSEWVCMCVCTVCRQRHQFLLLANWFKLTSKRNREKEVELAICSVKKCVCGYRKS